METKAMVFRNPRKNPQAMIRIGLLFLILFNVWPRFLHLTFNLGQPAPLGYEVEMSSTMLW
jgi:hypothetical protein